MKANELMIGDYIMFNKDIYKIEEISKKGWAHIIYNDGSECRVALSSDYILDAITPVPLTAEILVKNGFKENKYGEMILDEELGTSEIYLVLEESYDGEYYWWKVNNEIIAKIKGVHELQHVLRLCGINKEIEL